MDADNQDSRVKWEYLVLDGRGQSNATDQNNLNAYGDHGWELVCMEHGIFYFKRAR